MSPKKNKDKEKKKDKLKGNKGKVKALKEDKKKKKGSAANLEAGFLPVKTILGEPLSEAKIVNVSSSNLPLRAYRVKWDWELAEFEGSVRDVAPAPCVFRCGELNNNRNGHYTPLNAAWQFFWFDLCCHVFYGRYHQDLSKKEYDFLAEKWSGVGGDKAAFMNNKGLDKLANHVQGARLNQEDAALYTLVCGGATLTGTPIKNGNGVMMLKVDHFDGTKPPPPVESIDPYADPRIFFATIIGRKKVQGGFKVFPFPQLKTKDAPVPLIAKTDIFYPMADLEEIESPHKINPYFPQ